MKTHLEDINLASPTDNDFQNSQTAKRAYSLSPENKNLRQNNTKKTKT